MIVQSWNAWTDWEWFDFRLKLQQKTENFAQSKAQDYQVGLSFTQQKEQKQLILWKPNRTRIPFTVKL